MILAVFPYTFPAMNSFLTRLSQMPCVGLGGIFVALTAFSPALGSGAQLAVKGELLLAEDFREYESYTKERLPLKNGWLVRVAHGIWTRTPDGVQSVETPNHQPVLVIEGPFEDVIVELEFRYTAEPGKWAACRISAANHALHPRAYAASLWANVDYKSRAVGLVLEHDQWNGSVTQVARKMTDFAPDTWHPLRLELVGPRALAVSGEATTSGEHDRFSLPKTSLWLATGLSRHELRRLRIYAARPIADAPTAP
jgi:hypothetical protein